MESAQKIRCWLAVKWILTILLVVLGAGYMGVIIKENMAYAQRLMSEDLAVGVFYDNVRNVAIHSSSIFQSSMFPFVESKLMPTLVIGKPKRAKRL